MRVVARPPQELTAGDVLECCRDSAGHPHVTTLDRLGVPKAWQRTPVGTQKQRGLVHVPFGLGDCHRRKIGRKQATLPHDAVHRRTQVGLHMVKRRPLSGGIRDQLRTRGTREFRSARTASAPPFTGV